MSTSNRIGHPMRNRKKNRLIYNENEETSFGPNRMQLYHVSMNQNSSNSSNHSNHQHSNKHPKYIPIPSSRSILQHSYQEETLLYNRGKLSRNVVLALGSSLKTLLKLPKANNWINHEWFYGSIDQVLFLDENEFSFCLKDSFPQLKTRYLTRLEWSQIRRLMGKPRRCSSAFFQEERATLNTKRNKIRYLQQNKVADLNNYKDLPDNLPQPLVVGSQVSALSREHEGVFFGVIEGIDPTNGTYRINFNRTDIGSHSIPDYEVAPTDPPILTPLSSFQIKTRKIWHLSNRFVDCSSAQDSLSLLPDVNGINQEPSTDKLVKHRQKDKIDAKNIGGFPIKFLTYLAKASKILAIKRIKLLTFKSMNSEIERYTTMSEPISKSFKQIYANTILELDKINQELRFYLKKIQNFSLQIASEGKLKCLKPDLLTQKYLNESRSLIERLQSKFKVSEKTNNLIVNLMCLLVHLRGFRDCEISSYEFESLLRALSMIREMIHSSNHETFQNNVEIHIHHIMSSISHLGNVGAFSESIINSNNNNNHSKNDYNSND
ncbi:hypothetical protein SSS_01217 [Sarcoptes scabiei]|uniref:DIRP domain containing protein n=1 Tax=Sarcoptes scabiei TaxID=52283 RepID=A0A132A976_SARSC|nr:hypothetical protein SSS_01217 [Sarcoptes scabiei]KPM07536.1 DIRP domain containing protein [Sarcoptes scabiei]UXI15561.1 RING finger protein 121 [Sarcoptes scabiei]